MEPKELRNVVDALQEEKRMLEAEIREALMRFHGKTGLHVTYINFENHIALDGQLINTTVKATVEIP